MVARAGLASVVVSHEWLFAALSQTCVNPSLYDVLMLRYRSCKMVARVLFLVAMELLDSCQ